MEVRTGRVSGRETAKNRDGAEQVRLLQVVVTDRADVQTVQLVSQTGEESNPPDGSAVVLIPAGPALKLAVATLDRVTPDLAIGGKRIYSTDADGQTVKAEVRLDPDGKITIQNDAASQTIHPDGTVITANGAASFTMAPDGTFTFSGVSAIFDCPVTAPTVIGTTDVTAAGISGAAHVHPENDNGGPTDGPVNP